MTTSVAQAVSTPLAIQLVGEAEPRKLTLLDLSTAHLTAVTRGLMSNDAVDAIAYRKDEHGWFVYVPSKADGVEIGEHCPDDLAACIRYAQMHDADWIMFDCDAEVCGDLASFDDASGAAEQ